MRLAVLEPRDVEVELRVAAAALAQRASKICEFFTVMLENPAG
jgi:hypothetical protein